MTTLNSAPRRATLARQFTAVAALASVLGGCASIPTQKVVKGELPVVLGPSVRDNVTPMEGVMGCFADHVASTKRPAIIIGVGDVKDYTGKYSINEGNAITQGGALMVYSALGKLSGSVRVAERFDPSIAERELAYTDRRQLGDGAVHELGPKGGQQVPWLPYFGGTIQKSDYYIVGGITELNYDINSAGAEAAVNQVGAKARTYSQQVGIDLRIVDTKTLMVVKTVSLTKQFNGYEIGANVFRFFDSDLFDINIGAKGQEPLQLGIRTALEEGVIRLVSAVSKVDYQPCMNQRIGMRIATTPAEKLRTLENPPTDFIGAVLTWNQAMNAAEVTGGRLSGGVVQIAFDFGAADLAGPSLNLLDKIAAAAKNGGAAVTLVSRDTENLDPGKRDALTNQRIAAVTAALASRGIAPGAVQVTWRPDPADTSIHRDGPGLQEIAKLRIGG